MRAGNLDLFIIVKEIVSFSYETVLISLSSRSTMIPFCNDLAHIKLIATTKSVQIAIA